MVSLDVRYEPRISLQPPERWPAEDQKVTGALLDLRVEMLDGGFIVGRIAPVRTT